MIVKVLEFSTLENGERKEINSYLVDTDKITLATYKGKKVYKMLHEAIGNLEKTKTINHENLLSRAFHLRKIYHPEITPSLWMNVNEPFYAAADSVAELTINIVHTYIPKKKD